MENHDKEAIQESFRILVQQCNIDLLLPILVQKKVFSSEMITKYMVTTDDNLSRKRKLFLDIQKRGPHAFSNLVAALRETSQNYLADLLEPNGNAVVQPRKHVKPFMLPVYEDQQQIQNIANGSSSINAINLTNEPINIHVMPSTRLYDDQSQTIVPVYSTHSKNRGVVLIINIINYTNNVHPTRKGAEIDGRNLKELFLQIGMEVEMHVDLTGSQMREAIINFKSSPKVRCVDMVFVIIMGHGEEKSEITHIIGIDNDSITTKWVEEQFDNAHCKPLQGRPKIIMYQTCRGTAPDYGVRQHIEIDSAIQVVRTRSDMLIAYSTIPGNASHRDIFLGTWYINLFCEKMMNHAYNMHLEDIFKVIDNELACLRSNSKTMQTSMFTNLGFKSCYVHPKIYMEDGIIKNIHDG